MKLVIEDVKSFKDSIYAISKLVEEITFEVMPEETVVTSIDEATVAMGILKFKKDFFKEYVVEKKHELTMSIGYLLKIIKRAQSNDEMVLRVKKEGLLDVVFIGKSKRKFTIRLFENPIEKKKTPPYNYDEEIILENSLLKNAIKDCDLVDNECIFKADGETFTIKAGDLHEFKQILKRNELEEMAFKKEETGKYNLDYLRDMIKGSKIADITKIRFKTDHPLVINYIKENKIELIFILAPLVENK